MKWESSNKNVVTVDENGMVKAVSAGTAKITVEASETESYKAAAYTVTITVQKEVTPEPSACEYTKTEIRNQKKATCEEAGYTGDKYCSDCGELIEKGKEIAKLPLMPDLHPARKQRRLSHIKQ